MTPTISTRLKDFRIKRGMTLEAVAGLSGTSAAAIHRYENGWERFDIRTLEKITQALGVEMTIHFRLRPHNCNDGNLGEAYRILKPLFWDARLSKNQLKRHPDWLVQRVLQFGNLAQVKTLLALFGFTKIRDSFAKQRHKFDRKTQAAWSAYFTLKDPSCTLKSFQKEPVKFMSH
jgi:transcriptional regulator with XRE-family HTH domain